MNNNVTEPYVSAGQLNIPAGLFFTRQPQRASASGPDQTAVFSVTAIGAVSYQWQYNDGSGWTDIDGAESDTFETVIGPGMHGWKFRCIVEDADGASAASAAAYVTVTNTTEITLSGPIASIDYGPVNIKALLVDINAVQSGTGDPSPENVRPISGWDAVEIGRNNLDFNHPEALRGWQSIAYYSQYGSTEYDATTNTITLSRTMDASILLYLGFYTAGTTVHFTVDGFDTSAIPWRLRLFPSKITEGENFVSNISQQTSEVSTSVHEQTMTLNQDGYLYFSCYDIISQTSHAYETLVNPRTYYKTITLPSTCYGGTLDVVSGALTVTHGYIASYDDEELPGAWISDRDVYAEGTTPTAGAEVVYELAEPISVTLTATDVKTILGYNNIFADSGDVEVTYKGWPNAEPESVGLGSLNPNIIQDVFTPDVIEDVPQTLDVTPEFDTLL